VADLVGQMGKPDKVMTIVYAVGLTHHTTGGQLIRSGRCCSCCSAASAALGAA